MTTAMNAVNSGRHKPFVLLVGSIFEGWRATGPFASRELAEQYAEHQGHTQYVAMVMDTAKRWTGTAPDFHISGYPWVPMECQQVGSCTCSLCTVLHDEGCEG